jgi:hypothetical protein
LRRIRKLGRPAPVAFCAIPIVAFVCSNISHTRYIVPVERGRLGRVHRSPEKMTMLQKAVVAVAALGTTAIMFALTLA